MSNSDNHDTDLQQHSESVKCLNCQSVEVVDGYPNPLCASCRNYFLKFPVPNWVKAFGVGVGVIVVFSLFSFVGNLQTGIHMAKGEKAEKDRLYYTAQQEYSRVLSKVPDHVEAKAHLLIASYYNQDVTVFAEMLTGLKGKTFDNQDLFSEAENIANKESVIFPSETLMALLDSNAGADAPILLNKVLNYCEQYPIDISAGYKLAGLYLDEEQYDKAELALKKILNREPENISILVALSAVKRLQGDAKRAMEYIDRVILLNHENIYALSSKARVLVMLNKDQEALTIAKKVQRLNSSDQYNLATLAIVYHYLKRTKDRDKIISEAKASKDTSIMSYMDYAIDIAENKEKLRN